LPSLLARSLYMYRQSSCRSEEKQDISSFQTYTAYTAARVLVETKKK
jgi:hypothetical protein